MPYALLGSCPQLYRQDLPTTSLAHAEEAVTVAREAGLLNVRVSNRDPVSRAY